MRLLKKKKIEEHITEGTFKMKKLDENDVVILSRHLFRGLNTMIGNIRFWLGLWILPKDVSKFTNLILSKMSDDLQKMDSNQKNKITSIRLDFEFRD